MSSNRNENGYIKYLKKLTPNLPTLTAFVAPGGPKKIMDYKLTEGTCIGFPLYKEGKVAVQRAFMSAGSVFDPHEHKEHEWLIVYSGKLIVVLEDERYELTTAMSITIPPDTEHYVKCVEDCWMIGVTIPASQGYPDE